MLIIGTGDAERLDGGHRDDRIEGRGGGNVLSGRGGNDTLLGGQGNDRLIGGDGADSLDGGGGFDTVDYSKTQASVFIPLDSGHGSGGAIGDIYEDVEGFILSGHNDFFDGGETTEGLAAWGGEGVDHLEGGFGSDTLEGGAGGD